MIDPTTGASQSVAPASSSTADSAKAEDSLGMSTFLELMTTQLKYQDPTQPQDSSQFLEQLAQFSSVSGIQSMERSLTDAVSSLQSAQLLQATSIVGKQVLINSTEIVATDQLQPVSGQVDLANQTNGLQLQVQDASGQVVRTLDLGPRHTGLNEFTWDGLDHLGKPLPAGNYQLLPEVAEVDEPTPELYLRDQVVSVAIGADGKLHIQTQQLSAVSLSEVLEVS